MAWVKPHVGDIVTCRERREAYYSGTSGKPICFFEPGETGVVERVDLPTPVRIRRPGYTHHDYFCVVDFYKAGVPSRSAQITGGNLWWRVALYNDNIRMIRPVTAAYSSNDLHGLGLLHETVLHHLLAMDNVFARDLVHEIRMWRESGRREIFPTSQQMWMQEGQVLLERAEHLLRQLSREEAVRELREERGYRDVTYPVVQELRARGGTPHFVCVLQAPDGHAVICRTAEQLMHVRDGARERNETEAARRVPEPRKNVLLLLLRDVIQGEMNGALYEAQKGAEA